MTQTHESEGRVRPLARAALYAVMRRKQQVKRRHFIVIQSLLAVLILIQSILLQTYFQLKPVTYKLDNKTYSLIGESRDDTKDYLKQNKDQTGFEFAVPEKETTESAEHVGRKDDAFSATLPNQADQGITYTDTQNQIGITLVPKFYVGEGKKVDGDHIVYPMGSHKLIYTLKYNGLKEDIVLPKYAGDNLDYAFELSLPSGVEARLDAQGNVGIYSSDPTLFGNISFGSDADRAKIDKAREKSEKTNLVATIPAPIVKDNKGAEHTDKASFKLSAKNTKSAVEESANNQNIPAEVKAQLKTKTIKNTYTLTLQSKNLKDLNYPISIDPTIKTGCSTADCNGFSNGNFEAGMDYDSSSTLIKRSSLSGGMLNTWNNIAGEALATGNHATTGVAYNGFFYIAGDVNFLPRVPRFTKIMPDGSLSSPGIGTCATVWCNTLSTNTLGATDAQLLAYNGYIYKVGCRPSECGVTTNVVEYAKFNTNGTLVNPVTPASSAWQATSNFGQVRWDMSALAINGWLYSFGGCITNNPCTSTDILATVVRAPLNADGSVGAWTSTGTVNLPAGRYYTAATYYSGHIYVSGGASTAQGSNDEVYYIAVNTDGSLAGSSWNTSSNLMLRELAGHRMHALNGYLYVLGGYVSNPGAIVVNEVEYASINTDGSIGIWRQNTGMTGGNRWGFQSAVYNGAIYVTGGCGAGNCTTPNQTTVRVTPQPAGYTANYASAAPVTPRPTSKAWAASVVYNGYIYVTGGCSTTGASTTRSTFRCQGSPGVGALQTSDYGSLNTDGTVTWLGTTGFINSARWGHAAVAYNGYMYVAGGCLNGGAGNCPSLALSSSYEYAPITANGTLGTFTAGSTSFVVGRRQLALAAYNGYLFVSGGSTSATTDSANPDGSVYWAQIQSNALSCPSSQLGCVGAWTATTSLPNIAGGTGYATHASFAYNGFLYVVGGYYNNVLSAQGKIYYASISASGGLQNSGSCTPWCTNTNDLPAIGGYNYITGTAYKGYMYIGGADMYAYGKLNVDGSVTDMAAIDTDPTNNFISGMYFNASGSILAANGYLYAISGCANFSVPNCGNTVTTSYYGVINNGGSGMEGSLSSASTHGQGFQAHRLVAYNGWLYAMGGCNSACTNTGHNINGIEKAQIGSNGVLGAWSAEGAFTAPGKSSFGAVAVNGCLYVMGGQTLQTSPTPPIYSRDVQATHINTNGTLDGTVNGWNASCGTNMGAAAWTNRYGITTVTYNDYIYVVGGSTGVHLNEAWYAKSTTTGLANDAGCGTVWCQTSSMAELRNGLAAVVYNGYIYAIGGANSVNLRTVEYAAINANGTLGAWAYTSAIGTARAGATAVALNGYIYVMHGNGTIPLGGYEYAPVMPNGTLGEWQANNATWTTGRGAVGTTVYNGMVYMSGGNNGSGSTIAGVQQANLQSIPHAGSYTRLLDFDVGVKPTKLITRGSKRAGATVGVGSQTVNNTSTTFSNSQVVSDQTYGGAGALGLTLGTNTTLSRYLFLRYTIDDSQSAVFPDETNQSTLTDFDVYYNANSAKRLRNGRTFTNGADRGISPSP